MSSGGRVAPRRPPARRTDGVDGGEPSAGDTGDDASGVGASAASPSE